MARTRKPVVEVRRSQRRRRTVSAYRDGERVVVLIPDRFSRAEENEWVDRMLARLAAREERIRRTDHELLQRARRLISRYLTEHADDAVPASVRWVTNQNGRWGSCTPADRTIRISHRIQEMPDWVIDYVCCTNWRTSSCRATAPASGSWSTATPRPNAPAATSKASPPPTGLVLADD